MDKSVRKRGKTRGKGEDEEVPGNLDISRSAEDPVEKEKAKNKVAVSFFLFLSGLLSFTMLSCLALWLFVPISPESYELPDPPTTLSGDFTSNQRLLAAEILHEGKIIGPESFAYREGKIYTGTEDGWIAKITHSSVIKLVKLGRPLGLCFDKSTGLLYAADPVLGLLRVNLETKDYEVLVENSVGIINSVTVSGDGKTVFYSISSSNFSSAEFTKLMAEQPLDGKLMKLT